MKTSVVMNSPDRDLFGVNIRQETKTQFLNLSDLQEAYTRARVLNGWSNKGQVQDILNQKENTERIFCLLDEMKIINSGYTEFMERVEKAGLLKLLKQIGVYRTTGARHTRNTWCHPAIWVMVALELNPRLYAKVSLWLGDQLILNRIEAGNFYKGLTRAIAKFPNPDYVRLAKALNHKIFGRHETGIRNIATKEELQKLTELEGHLAFAIDMGLITTFEECVKLLIDNL